jgi:hypothetical protein
MEKNPATKRYKVSVDRNHVERSFYEVTAPADPNSPAFHQVIQECIAGKHPSIDSEVGHRAGHVEYSEIDPALVPVKTSEVVEPTLEEEMEEEPKDSPSFRKALDEAKGLTLHVCEVSGIPFFAYEEQGPVVPFEEARSAAERDQWIEDKRWEQGDEVVHMDWLNSWVNLSRMQLTQDFSLYWKELLAATGEDIRPYLDK